MTVCHACTRGVMHVPDMSLVMSYRCVMVICHGDISLGFLVCHGDMSWQYVMRICHACTRGVMHVPGMSWRLVMQRCHACNAGMSW